MSFFPVIPILSFIVFAIISHHKGFASGYSWRESFLRSAIICGLFVVMSTETLSLFSAVSFFPVLLIWTLLLAAGTSILWKIRRDMLWPRFQSAEPLLLSEKLVLLISGVVVFTSGVIALKSAPNTWDAMTYHMSRVMHWMQNKSVAHYPTHIERQLYQSPFAEFVILHLQILSRGKDFLANGVQWFSMVGSLVGVSLIAKALGAGRRGQILTAGFTALIPTGILQSVSTQNDYVVSFWLVCFIYFAIISDQEARTWELAGSLGLATLTKPTAYLYAFPFCLLYLMWQWEKKRGWKFLRSIVVLAGAVVILNSGHYARNTAVFGTPLAHGKESYRNEKMSVPIAVANVLKNASLHLGTPWMSVNNKIEAVVKGAQRVLGVSVDDPAVNWSEYKLNPFVLNENIAGNPAHFLMMFFAFFLLVARPVELSRRLLWYGVALLSGGMLFCLILKWQPFHARLHLPFFVLSCPLIAIAFSRLKTFLPAYVVLSILSVGAFHCLLFNEQHPILGEHTIWNKKRLDQYFLYQPSRRYSTFLAAKVLADLKCRDIGLVLREDSWEYPLWVSLAYYGLKDFRIRHVNVRNSSAEARAGQPDFVPCAVVLIEAGNRPRIETKGYVYARVWQSPKTQIFLRTRLRSTDLPR